MVLGQCHVLLCQCHELQSLLLYHYWGEKLIVENFTKHLPWNLLQGVVSQVAWLDRSPPRLTNFAVSSNYYADPQPKWTSYVVQHHLCIIKLDNGNLWTYASHEQAVTILQKVVHVALIKLSRLGYLTLITRLDTRSMCSHWHPSHCAAGTPDLSYSPLEAQQTMVEVGEELCLARR